MARASGGGGGKIVQIVNAQTGAVATGSTILPLDDTIPQITEGDEYMTLAITPVNALNTLIIEIVVNLASGIADAWLSAALFQDATADALAATNILRSTINTHINLKFTYKMATGTTSATTFRVRCGIHTAGTTTLNGRAGGRQLGGVFMSSITITEVAP